jgi:hypothetical protein
MAFDEPPFGWTEQSACAPGSITRLDSRYIGETTCRGHCISRTKRDGLTFYDTFVGRSVLLNGVDKAEALAQATGGSLRKDALTDWLWGKVNLVLSRRK